METIIEASQDVTAISPVDQEIATLTVNAAALIFVANGADPILNRIHEECAKHKPDISTEKGRKAIASLAYKVARSKTALDKVGQNLVAGKKAEIAAVDAERKRLRDDLDALRDSVRRPLDEFEEREEKRIADHERCLAEIEQCAGHCYPATPEQIEQTILNVRSYSGRDWQEFGFRADEKITEVLKRLGEAKADSQRRYDEQAELERLRAEEARRLQEERERRIAEEAAEKAKREAEAQAERERTAAEAKAKAELEAVERKAREEREAVERVAREAAEATAREEAARQAEKQRKMQELARQQQEAEERARQAVLAQEKAEREAAEAVERERQRVAAEQAAQAAEEAKREANRKHRAKINGEACAALIAIGLPETIAKNVVIAIAKGEVPNVKISY